MPDPLYDAVEDPSPSPVSERYNAVFESLDITTKETSSIEIDVADIEQVEARIAEQIRQDPVQLRHDAAHVLGTGVDDDSDIAPTEISLMDSADDAHVPIANIRSDHLARLITVTGRVDTVSPILSVPTTAVFTCNRCGTQSRIAHTPHTDLSSPSRPCPGCEQSSPRSFSREETPHHDRQQVRVTATAEHAPDGESQASLVVDLTGDLVDSVTPGDRVTVTGVLRHEPPGVTNDTTTPDKYLAATALTTESALEQTTPVSEQLTDIDIERIQAVSDRDDVVEALSESIAPHVHGHETEKLALLLQQVGGVRKPYTDDTTLRGSIHVLIIGDPETGGSRLLDGQATVAPHAVTVNGTLTTTVGVTAATERTASRLDGRTWSVKAGALVHGHGGITCIDNLDSLPQDAHRSLADVLETQSVTVTKGTRNTTLPAATAVAGTATPSDGRFDSFEPIGDQLDIGTNLLTAFDLVFIEQDTPDVRTDTDRAEHILETQAVGEHAAQNDEPVVSAASPDIDPSTDPPFPPAFVRQYIAYARQACTPTMSEAATAALEDFYVDMRSQGVDKEVPVPITAQHLETLVRLAEACARLRLSDTVTEADATRAIEVLTASLQDLGVDPEPDDVLVEKPGGEKTASSDQSTLNDSDRFMDIIADLEDQTDYGVPYDDLIDEAENRGLDREWAESKLGDFEEGGKVYEPKTGYYRLT